MPTFMPAALTIALGTLTLLPAPAQKKSAPVDVSKSVIGSCNGKPIFWGEFVEKARRDQSIAFNQALSQAVSKDIGETLFGAKPKSSYSLTRNQALKLLLANPGPQLSNMLNAELQEEAINQDAAKQGVKVTPAQDEAKLHEILDGLRKTGRMPVGQTDQKFLEEKHLVKSSVLHQVHSMLMMSGVADKLLVIKVGHPITSADYLIASHILLIIPPPAPTDKPEEIKKKEDEKQAKAKSIYEEITTGKKSFEAAAKEYSDDGSKEKGGDLGPFLRGMMVKDFENAAFSQKLNVVGMPIKSQFGYHIIKVTKLGKDMTAAEKKAGMDQLNGTMAQEYRQGVMARAKLVNKLSSNAQPSNIGIPNGRFGGGRPRPRMPKPSVGNIKRPNP